MTWTQPVCNTCWLDEHPNEYHPVRLRENVRERETCCKCGEVTYSGIYIRIDPSTVRFPRSDD